MRLAYSVVPCAALLLFSVPHADAQHKIYKSDLSCFQGPLALRIGTTLAALRKLGVLQQEKVEPPDRLGADLRTLTFEGLRLGVVSPKDKPGQAVVDYAQITSSKWSIAPGLQVGMTLQDLGSRLNQKPSPKGGELEVCGDTDCIVFELKNQRVETITYTCYTG